jgi:hypothetical protein
VIAGETVGWKWVNRPPRPWPIASRFLNKKYTKLEQFSKQAILAATLTLEQEK